MGSAVDNFRVHTNCIPLGRGERWIAIKQFNDSFCESGSGWVYCVGKFGRVCAMELFNRLIKCDSDWSNVICRNWKRYATRFSGMYYRARRASSMCIFLSLPRVFNCISTSHDKSFPFEPFGSLSLEVTSHHLSFPAVLNLAVADWISGRLSWPLAIAAIFNISISIHREEEPLELKLPTIVFHSLEYS